MANGMNRHDEALEESADAHQGRQEAQGLLTGEGAAMALRDDPHLVQSVVSSYKLGESPQDIAARHGISTRSVYNLMMAGAGDQYDSMITGMLVARIADADEMLRDADDAVQIARAREIARFARMDFERRRPSLYGQRQQVDVTVRGDLEGKLRTAKARVIDTTASQVTVECGDSSE